MWYDMTVDNTWPTRHKTVKAMPVQRRPTIDDTEPTPKRHRFNTLCLLGKADNSAVGSALVHNRRRWTNATVTPIQHPAPAVGIMSGHCRKDIQTPNQDMVKRRPFCPAYTTRQKKEAGLVLGQRLQRWPNTDPTKGSSPVYAVPPVYYLLL